MSHREPDMHPNLIGTYFRSIIRRRDGVLGNADIDCFSAWLEETASEAGMDPKDILRIRLLMEDLLLSMQGHFGESKDVLVTFELRFGHPRLRIETKGEPYNPLTEQNACLGEWESILGATIGIPTQYSYSNGTNVLRLLIPPMHINPVLRLAMFVLIGASLGLVGNMVLPHAMDGTIAAVLLQPLYGMWIRLLNAISGPIVFLTVTTTMLGMRQVDAKGGDSKRGIVRYFVLSIMAVTIATIVASAVHPLEQSELQVDSDLAKTLIDSVFSVVPSNIFDPFVESNTSQLLFLAFALGYLLTKLGNGAETLRKCVVEANAMGLRTAGWVSRLVPFFVAVFIFLEIASNQMGVLADIWRPLTLSLAMSVTGMLIALAVMAMRMGVSPLLLATKLKGPFLVALRTGSLDRAFDEMLDSDVRLLGIDRGYSQEAAPQGLVLYMPVSAIGTIAFTIYVAQVFGVQSTVVWYVTAAIMAVVVFVATPPVPGANLLAYVVLFSTLGIPSGALIDAMIFDVMFGIFAGAANQAMLQLEMMLQADHLGLLDRERLKAPSEGGRQG